MRRQRTPALALLALLVASAALAGCLGGPANPGTDGDDGEDDGTPTAETPVWELGFSWTYDVSTENFPETESEMLVYGDDGNNYLIGVTDRRQALIHALFNVNPQLGRIQKGNLAVYEDGEPRPMYDFPLTPGKSWETDIFVSQHGGTLTATATWEEEIETGVGPMEGFNVRATNPEGFTVIYDHIPELRWFSKLVVTDEDGKLLHSLHVTDHAEATSGTGWFVRGDDLFQEAFTTSQCGLAGCERQVLVDGASAKGGKYGGYHLVAYNVLVTVPDDGRAEVVIRDGAGDTVYERNFLQDQQDEFKFDVTRDFAPGEWTVDVRLSGGATAEVRLAGAWEYSGEV